MRGLDYIKHTLVCLITSFIFSQTVPAQTFVTGSSDDVTAPVLVSGPDATFITDSSATISWITNELSDSRTYYTKGTAPSQVRGGLDYSSSHSVVLAQLEPGSTYLYRIESVDPAGNKLVSENLLFTTLTESGVPSEPIITALAPTSSDVTVAFIQETDGGSPITNYEYSADAQSWLPLNPAQGLSPIKITGLASGTTYVGVIRALNAIGPGASSRAFEFTTESVPPIATIPGSPTSLTPLSGDGQVEVAFTPPSSDGGSPIFSYEYSLNGEGWRSFSPEVNQSPGLITGLVNEETYWISLRAVNSVGPGTPSEIVSAIPSVDPGTPPSAQCGLADGITTVFEPAGAELCQSGGASTVEFNGGGWNWSCRTSQIGTQQACSASLEGSRGYIEIGGLNWRVDRENSAGFIDGFDGSNDTPPDLEFPLGFVQFKLIGGIPGSYASVVIRYQAELPEGSGWWKYGPTNDDPAPQWYMFDRASISGDTVTLVLQDGGSGDNDLSANGEIYDPSGAGVLAVIPSPPKPVPTLRAWALVLLAVLLVLLATWQQAQGPRHAKPE